MLFDFDGVLVDSEPFYYRSYREALAPLGIVVEASEYWVAWTSKGLGLDRFLEDRGITGVSTAAIKQRQSSLYREFCGSGLIRLFPGARELLERLPGLGTRYAIASNTSSDLVRTILRLEGAVVPPVFGGEGMSPKPSPEIFLHASDCLGAAPADTLVFEDAEKGLTAAGRGGFKSVLVRNDINREFALEADFEVGGTSELLPLLRDALT